MTVAAISNQQNATTKTMTAVTEICNNKQSNYGGSSDQQNVATTNKATMTAVAGTNKMQQSGQWRWRQKYATINKATMVTATEKLQQSTKRQWRRRGKGQQTKCSNQDDGDGNQENATITKATTTASGAIGERRKEELVQTASKMTDEEWTELSAARSLSSLAASSVTSITDTNNN